MAPTAVYSNRHKALRRVFELHYGRFVSDAIWYKTVRSVKECLGIQIMDSRAEHVYKLLGSMKKTLPSFAIKSTYFPICWDAFQRYRQMDREMTCIEFIADLLVYLDLRDLPRNSWYSWFVAAAIPFKRNHRHKTGEFALVAFLGARWKWNKEQSKMRDAMRVIEERTITVGSVPCK
jgi:hypothetical protein